MPSPITCPICGRSNNATALFCSTCIAPLRVQKLADLDPADLLQSLDHLLAVLASVRRSPGEEPDDDLFRAYLSAFWLRPETALIQFVEARLLAPLFQDKLRAPFLDIGCGNGVHTSLVHGWRFADDFDVFQDADVSAADMFNAAPQDMRVNLTRPGRPIDFGVDIKPSMIQRTRLLGSFREVMIADAARLPLPDASIGCIYSNVIRDFEETLDPVLRECARLLQPRRHLILISPTEHYRDLLFYEPRARSAADTDTALAERYQRLDRGRSIFCRQQVPTAAWQDRLARCGLALIQSIDYAPKPLLEFWDTGLRPFSPALIKWVRLFPPAALPAIKRQIISALAALLRPFTKPPEQGEPCAFRILIARKENP